VLKQQALELGIPLEIVAGSAPGWSDPWSRARRCTVHEDTNGWWTHSVSDEGYVIDDAEVQLARIVAVVH
jgi:hypothetical protein